MVMSCSKPWPFDRPSATERRTSVKSMDGSSGCNRLTAPQAILWSTGSPTKKFHMFHVSYFSCSRCSRTNPWLETETIPSGNQTWRAGKCTIYRSLSAVKSPIPVRGFSIAMFLVVEPALWKRYEFIYWDYMTTPHYIRTVISQSCSRKTTQQMWWQSRRVCFLSSISSLVLVNSRLSPSVSKPARARDGMGRAPVMTGKSHQNWKKKTWEIAGQPSLYI